MSRFAIEAGKLNTLLNIGVSVNKDILIHFLENELLFCQNDSSNVYMVIARIPKNQFAEYEFSEHVMMGFSVQTIQSIIPKTNEVVHFEYEDKILTVKTEKFVYKTPTLVPNTFPKFAMDTELLPSKCKKFEDSFSTVICSIASKDLKEGVNLIKNASGTDNRADRIQFKCENGKLYLRFRSANNEKFDYLLIEGDGIGEGSAIYSQDFIVTMSKIMSDICSTSTIYYGENTPIVIGNVDNTDVIAVKLILAPRLLSEEDIEIWK